MEYSPLALTGGSPSVSAAEADAPGGGLRGLGAIIERIALVVEQETAAIGADLGFDLKASNARKSRCLYELSRAVRGAALSELAAEHGDSLKRLRGVLKRNEIAVRAHLEAVTEIAGLLRGAIERAQSDGTYGASGWEAAGSGWSRA